MSSSGCINRVLIPELDSGFLTVGAAEIVAAGGWDMRGGTLGAYAGKVGFTGPA